jgi:hypothetical protein
MINHIFYGKIDLTTLNVSQVHEKWLNERLENLQIAIEKGEVAASECLQGALIEVILKKQSKIDWLGVFNEYLLSEEGLPMAYSLAYGKKLHKFEAQFEQITVQSIHTYWFINKLLNPDYKDEKLIRALSEFWQPSGWFYNPQVSITTERYRMRVELFMSLAMAVEILLDAENNEAFKDKVEAHIHTEPVTNYLSAEYFRTETLLRIQKPAYIKSVEDKLHKLLLSCQLDGGFSDFDVKSKVDDYMGTAKRVGRDVALLSAISTLHAKSLSDIIGDSNIANNSVGAFVKMQQANPLVFGAFKMRDLEPEFGPSITTHEIIAASILTNNYLA